MIHLPQMLLQQPPPYPKPLSNPFFSPSPLPTLQFRQNPNQFRRNSFLLHASTDTKALPHSAIQRIADKLRSLGYVEDNHNNQQISPPEETLTSSPGEIFVPLPNRLPKYRVGHTLDPSWSTPENPVPEPGSGNAIRRYNELRREVWKEKVKRRGEGKREGENVPTMAELKLPGEELRRLRRLGIAVQTKLKIGKAGITEGIVNGIHERWRRTELVKIVCEDMCRLNMKRTHDLLERKTGGLVVWRAGSIIILYRGADYKYPYFFVHKVKPNDASSGDSMSSSTDSQEGGVEESYSTGTDGTTSVGQTKITQPPLIQGVGSRTRVRFQLPGEAQLAEEADQLLHGLGPRFADWYGYDPQPVDADLLPAIVPGYRKPFRLLPFGVQPKLTNDEMTILRRLGRPLPCHFALGRNRKHQGLAAAILKLWEKCEIAKIAVKRGVQNTNSELMAEELKWLTGGTILTRDKEYIVLYRGKDFLPATVSSAIEQRRNHGVHGLEKKKISSSSDANMNKDEEKESPSAATHGRTRDQKLEVATEQDQKLEVSIEHDQKLEVAIEQRKLKYREAAIKRTSSKLSQALMRKEKAEKLLAELEKEEIKQQLEVDKEGITEEERYMLRRVGLKMNPFLLLGRRGVFAGTVENMHLHWKYRELVKILCGDTSIDEVHAIARTLEAESGGILVAVERVRKGHAIIVYRGKNYKRPACLRPQTLLNKREALKRSIEAQRRESLKLHVLKLGKNVDELKLKLAKNGEINMHGEKDPEVQLEHETKKSLSADYMEPDTDLELYKSYPIDQDNGQAGELHEGDSVSSNKNESVKASHSPEANCQDGAREFSMEFEGEESLEFGITKHETHTSRDSEQTRQHDLLKVSSMKHDDKDGCESTEAISKASSVLVKGIDGFLEMDSESEESKSRSTSTCPDAFKLEGSTSSLNVRNTEPCASVTRNDAPFVDSSVHWPRVKESNGKPHRAALLSNKERLLLRKQALKMKKRPVLAVGRSNIVSGVAKTIKTHFQKHPLAIVNIKGRAKGTSVQEVVSKLEEETGAVLVSQEPSKVILYRGWGATENPNKTNENNNRDLTNAPSDIIKPTISPELISAIRLECGLQENQERKAVS